MYTDMTQGRMCRLQRERMRSTWRPYAFDEAARRAADAYDAAADMYDHEALGFWARVGEATVARLGLRMGDRVLDAAAGSGASALVAAGAVGADGAVVGVDLAPALLELARAKAEAAGLGNLDFRLGDMRSLGFPDESFDAVVCVFGVFFVPDRVALMRELWRLVKPGGKLAITTWGPDVLEPGSSVFWHAVGTERPDLVHAFNPWDDLIEPEQVVALFTDAGVESATAELEIADQPLRSPGDWWAIVLGSGFRTTVEALAPVERDDVKDQTLRAMANVRAVRASAIYAHAEKPLQDQVVS
jgi:ubiquinone/menaquinone biosynthesis C-methylase UbiE